MEDHMASIRMKHTGATAADLTIEYTIDEARKVVEIEASAFDSALIEDFFLSVLQRRLGIDAVRDDRTDLNPPPPPYRVFLTIKKQRYEAKLHLLMDIGGTKGRATVVLLPL